MEYEFQIGLTLVGLTYVTELAVPLLVPESGYQRFSATVPLGNHAARGFGNPATTWRWVFLSLAQRDQLKVFCPGASAAVYIRTKKRDATEVWADFLCQMVWPEEEEVRARRVLDFTVLFF